MKVFVFGAGGIIGQHMLLHRPAGVDAHFFRKTAGNSHLYHSWDLGQLGTVPGALQFAAMLNNEEPDVIVNLAGECNVDKVEADPDRYRFLNTVFPVRLAKWCDLSDADYIHVSSQAVFEGSIPPYGPDSELAPVNMYGSQKYSAEMDLRAECERWTIVRPTFTIGVRPIPAVGRLNPVEAMLLGQLEQVDDRFFSPLFADDAARFLWQIALNPIAGQTVHLGIPTMRSRATIAAELGVKYVSVPSSHFPTIAPRPKNTTYSRDSLFEIPYSVGLDRIKLAFESMQTVGFYQRARELALFFKINFNEALAKLSQGFGPLHNEVTADFKAFFADKPATQMADVQIEPSGGMKVLTKSTTWYREEDLLRWYRETPAYCWELSAYHCDPGFNYAGMCQGIAEALANHTAFNVLCLGDGIGDLTLELRKRGMNAVYHDLDNSKTAQFAQFRFWMYGKEGPSAMTNTFAPLLAPIVDQGYDAIASLDFLEHVPNVEQWVRAIFAALRPGGVFVAQNAFAMGSGADGSMPMHLDQNDVFEKTWDPLLTEIGFKQLAPQWYQKPL